MGSDWGMGSPSHASDDVITCKVFRSKCSVYIYIYRTDNMFGWLRVSVIPFVVVSAAVFIREMRFIEL